MTPYRRYIAFLLLALAFVPRGTAWADSTINTANPVQGVPYSAAPIRQNFVAAANDIEALQSMNAGASAPANPVLGQLWLETPTGQTVYNLKIWDDRTSQWVVIAYLDSVNSLWIAPVGGGLPQTILTSDTTNLGAYPNTVLTVTGAGPVTSFGASAPAGTIKVLSFSGATELVYNATSMILPGAANITSAAGDMAIAVARGSGNWQVLFFQSAAATVAQGGTGRTSLTQYAVLLGAGTGAVNFASPGTSGYPLLSTGSAANPAFGLLNLAVGATGTLSAANGGTGLSSLTAHNLLIGNGTSAATLLPPGSTGLPLVSLGASVDPGYAVLGVVGGGTGRATLTAHTVLLGNGTGTVTMLGPGAANMPLVGQGGALDPAFTALDISTAGVTGVLPVARGGLGVASPTDHAVLVGSGTSAVTPVGPGTSGFPLIGAGAGADPSFTALNLAGAGVTGVLPQVNFTMTPVFTTVGTTGLATLNSLSVSTTASIGTNLGVNGDLAVTGVSAFADDVTFSTSLARDATFYLSMSGSNPVINLGTNTYLTLNRGTSVFDLYIGGVNVLRITSAGNVTIPGCLNYNGGTLGGCL